MLLYYFLLLLHLRNDFCIFLLHKKAFLLKNNDYKVKNTKYLLSSLTNID